MKGDELPVMQRQNELARLVAAGQRSDNGEKCSFVRSLVRSLVLVRQLTAAGPIARRGHRD